MKLIVISVILSVIAVESEAFTHICRDNKNIIVEVARKSNNNELTTYEYKRNNEYTIYFKMFIPMKSYVKIEFDAPVNIKVDTRLVTTSLKSDDSAFYMLYIKEDMDSTFNFTVTALMPEVVPHLKSIDVNNQDYCTEPDNYFFERAIYKAERTPPDHRTSQSAKESCGRRKVTYTELIVNSSPTKPGDWPWHAAIYRLEKSSIKYICGGTLIAKHFILSAAHCATSRGVPVLPEIMSVVLGKYHLIGGDISTQEREVQEIIVHESFSYRNLNHDIALLKLKTEATFNDYVQPACLWNDKVNKKLSSENIFGTVVGWGFDHTNTLSLELRQAKLPIVNEITCIRSKPLFYATLLNEHKFCAGYRNGTSACNGDSGGGFQVFIPDFTRDNDDTDSGSWFVRGIVSMTVAKTDANVCDPEYYVIFTDVDKYGSWIEQFVNQRQIYDTAPWESTTNKPQISPGENDAEKANEARLTSIASQLSSWFQHNPTPRNVFHFDLGGI